MNRDDIVRLCQQAPTIGAVKHEEFADYITVLDNNRRVNGQWEKQEAAYMSVDGKVAMANEDHRRQNKQLHFEDPIVLVDDEQQLTLMITINSEMYGRRHGIATSRRIGGSPYEMAHPWEVAETSAIGRALSVMGYGVLPGSGLASADDVKRAREAEATHHSNGNGNGNGSRRQSPTLPAPRHDVPRRGQRPVSDFQKQKIYELFGDLYPSLDTEAGVDTLFKREVGYDLSHATYEEGRQITAYLLREKRSNDDTEEIQPPIAVNS
jgi:hypothetical protein